MITQQLVHQFDGIIGVNSKPGVGSVFYFELKIPSVNDVNNQMVDACYTNDFKFEWNPGVKYIDDVNLRIN